MNENVIDDERQRIVRGEPRRQPRQSQREIQLVRRAVAHAVHSDRRAPLADAEQMRLVILAVGDRQPGEAAGGERCEEVARAILNRQPDASSVETDGRVVSFTFQGDREALSTLLDRLLQEGVQIVRFGPGPERFDELAAGLSEVNGKVAS